MNIFDECSYLLDSDFDSDISDCLADASDEYVRLGDVLRYLRLSRGYTQEDVTSSLCMNRFAYCRKECGTSSLSIRELLALCEFYHLTPNDFLGYGSIDYALVSLSNLNKRVRHSRRSRFRCSPN